MVKGPDVPVFILLSDSYNRTVQEEYNGRAGLSMRHVIFLFVCGRNSVEELKVLLAHEYHHICRLHQIETKETEYTLLDTMIMEGLAEQAVTERYTEKTMHRGRRIFQKKRLFIIGKMLYMKE